MEITVVESLDGKYGPQLKDKQGYLSFGKFYDGSTKFNPGTVLDVELYTSPKGNRYINKLQLVDSPAPVKAAPKVVKAKKAVHEEEVHGDVPAIPSGMASKISPFAARDFDKEARGKTRCALLQSLLSNPTVDLKNQKELSDLVEWGVGLVFEDSK